MILRAIKRLMHAARLSDPAYRFLFENGPLDEVVALDCETTGMDVRRDDIITIAAVHIQGNRILTSKRFEAIVRPEARMNIDAIKVHRLREMDVVEASEVGAVIPQFLHFIGARPLVGYYVDFGVRMLNKYLRRLVGIELPNPRIEVSKLYYDRKYGDAPPGTTIDLSFRAILEDFDLPRLNQHNAFNDALMAAIMYLRLRDLQQREIHIPRHRQIDRPQTTIA